MKRIVLLLACAATVFGKFIPFTQGFGSRKVTNYNYGPFKKYVEAYNLNHFDKVEKSEEPRIPKRIHVIWLGSPLPKHYDQIIESWKIHHPDWEFKLWTDDDIGSFPLETKESIHEAKNHGQRSDILRYEILYRYGGLYVDTDFMCLKPHDILHHTCDFYTAMGDRLVYNGIIGSAPKHPIIQACINDINRIKKFSQSVGGIVGQTGPRLIMKAVSNHFSRSIDGAIVYPAVYFYAFPSSMRTRYWRSQDFNVVKPHISEDAFAVHLWALSWTGRSPSPHPITRKPTSKET